MSCSARSSFLAHSSVSRASSSFRATAASYLDCSTPSSSSTFLRAACFSASLACVTSSLPLASASAAFFGATTLATRSYLSMATTQAHMPLAAMDAWPARSSLKSSLVRNCSRTLPMDLGLMLSRSKSMRRARKPLELLSSFLAGPQKSSIFFVGSAGSLMRSGFSPSITSTADSTITMTEDGLERLLTNLRSFSSSVLRARMADSSAGMASARSASHSSATALTAASSLAATSASADTRPRTSSTPGSFSWISSISAAVSFCDWTSTGCISSSCFCRPATCVAASLSFSRPTT
mmetsp:Transcript_17165/g.65041  ORF Transcript_17165/g.65041 Transcript_17165/m.65041 type:complete len:294 (-) Transcript_17165:5398-6279(-)